MQHSYPLSHPQKTSIAKAITKLHAYTFHAPSAFINVVFQDLTSAAHAAPSTNESVYFVGGEPTPEPQGPNRILAMVRVGSSRKKADFDTLAEEIETAWFDAVGQPRDQNEREAKRMQWIAFYPLVTARENGVVIPEV